MSVVERAVLVTGSGSGIGAAIVRRLAKPGVGILVHALANRAGCERVAAEARAAGAATAIELGDLSQPGVGAALVVATAKAFGRLDVLVANAGFPDKRNIGQLDRAGLDYIYAAILGGFFDMVTAARPHLERARDGRVIAISTHNAHVFRADYPAYPGSGGVKHGLETMTRAVAAQFAPHGITANAVAPGLIRKDAQTDQFYTAAQWQALADKVPLRRLGEPDEVAALVQFLVSKDAGYITGQVIHINGGLV
ncbi:MAG: SDR family oxidoreductase [Alphaproteobacteria bacterium]|nr:SDR family oxidoreductase [Alphaproteobacteria bacterium]